MPTYWNTQLTSTYTTASGTDLNIVTERDQLIAVDGNGRIYEGEANNLYSKSDRPTPMKREGDPQISARLMFSFVKSKLTKTEQTRLQKRIDNLRYLLDTCQETGQEALRDELLFQAAIALRRQEVAACGYDRYVDVETVRKYIGSTKTPVRFDPLEKFPRPIPKPVRTIIEKVRKKGLFDVLHVLYTNPLDTPPKKSVKEKIVEKDPILFGAFDYDPDVLYFITDWVDEVCDLTMEKFIGEIRKVDPKYDARAVPPVRFQDVTRILDEAKRKHTLLKETNRDNWRDSSVEAGELGKKKPSLWRRFRIWLKEGAP